jgi:flagellar assembly protein FliH
MARIIKQGKCSYARIEPVQPPPETGRDGSMAVGGDKGAEGTGRPFSFNSLKQLFPKEAREANGEAKEAKEQEDQDLDGTGRDRQEASSEIDRLAAEARQIKERAEKEAEEIIDSARKRAEEIESQAYSAGYDQGQKDGLEIGRQQYQIKIQHLESVINQLQEESMKLASKYEAQLLGVAIAVARQVVGKELNENSQAVLEAIRSALANVVEGSSMTIHLHPRDFESVSKDLDSLFSRPGANRIELKPDQAVDRGGCLIQTDFGLIDATVESRWGAVIHEIDTVLKERTGLGLCPPLKAPPSPMDDHELDTEGEGADRSLDEEAGGQK